MMRSTTIQHRQYNHLFRKYKKADKNPNIQNNLVIREDVQRLKAKKYNRSTQEVHPLNIGSTKNRQNPNAQKIKNKNPHPREVQSVIPRSTSGDCRKYKR
jgi:hypothetical protein